MTILSEAFQPSAAIKIDLQVPLLARQALLRFSEITGASDICIAGGFARGLYMQQFLGLNAQMNDIDIFADISLEKFDAFRTQLEIEFGVPIRFHLGQFEKEEHPRGLIEFALPQSLRNACAGVESIQLNFGTSHPWANPYKYIDRANLGINQIAIHSDGNVTASQSFLDDMANRTMTMNPDRDWSAHDWVRTVKSLDRMLAERPEFNGWKSIVTSKPYMPITGTFWDVQKLISSGPVNK